MLWYQIRGQKSRRLLNYLTFRKAQKYGWALSFCNKGRFYLQAKFIVNGVEYGLCTMAEEDSFSKQLNKLVRSLNVTSEQVTTKEYEKNLFSL